MKKSKHFCSRQPRWLILSVVVECVPLSFVPCVRAAAPADNKSPSAPIGPGVVLRDRVNVRARPDRTAEVITQLAKGDVVTVLERKILATQDKGTDWLRVELSPTAKCFVSSKLLVNGAATSDNVHVRCGAGTNFQGIGKLMKGEKVEVVKTMGDWTQIKPTVNCSGWISAELVEVKAAAAPAIVAPPVIEVAPAPAVAPAVAPSATPTPATPPIHVTDRDPDMIERYTVTVGVLQTAPTEPKSPAQYQLMTQEIGRRQYRMDYIEAPGVNVTEFLGKLVRVHGNERWRKGDRYPVLTAERIEMVW
jgi:uncharacterized protein YgiM (DUF1202 family)